MAPTFPREVRRWRTHRRNKPWSKLTTPSVGDRLKLADGSKISVIGGGPAGSFFSFFLLDMAARVGLDIAVDIYEPRDFSRSGPSGCNMCAGVISESLVQTLAVEGINLPLSTVQAGIEAYVLHTQEGSVRISTPTNEVRVAAVYRGAGPSLGSVPPPESFDKLLLGLAVDKGARWIPERVTQVRWDNGKPQVSTAHRTPTAYDALVVATGVNSAALKLFEGTALAYRPPSATKAAIREYSLDAQQVELQMGSAMHVFLLDIPRLRFAAAIPKDGSVTVVLLGEDIDSGLVDSVLNSPALRNCMPPGWTPDAPSCRCSPRLNVRAAVQPFGDRVVFIGDCASNRLYKDGIGGAYRAAKAAASTAIFHGVSAEAFRQYYWPTCRDIDGDNVAGRLIFWVTRQIQRSSAARRAMLQMAATEQAETWRRKRMSFVLWNTFSGSASYRQILTQALHPACLVWLAWHIVWGALPHLGIFIRVSGGRSASQGSQIQSVE